MGFAAKHSLPASYCKVNRSEVSRRASFLTLGEHANQKEKLMENNIARLSDLKLMQDSQSYSEGHDCGHKWADDHAEPIELERLIEVRDEQRRRGQWEDWFDGRDSVWCAGEILHHMIMGGDAVYGGHDRTESAEFWEFVGASDEQQADCQFVLGFADSAAEVWETVKT